MTQTTDEGRRATPEQLQALRDAYSDHRCRWADEVAQVVPTAQPYPKCRPNSYRLKPAPGTDEEGDPQG